MESLPTGGQSVSRMLPAGRNPSSARIIPTDRNSPAAAPAAESSRLSIGSCPSNCMREAPIASRTATSFCRAMARAIGRFATLKQAISSTSPTMHISTIRAVE